jgi:secreted Zn-dependent insulinase-like peptidase
MSISKVIKSISDKRIYLPLSLKNDLECLIISDKDAQKSAAALSVNVGSFMDPIEAQGLAHYL